MRVIKGLLALEMNSDKVVIVRGSNNAGVCGPNPQPPEANGSLGSEPRRSGDF